MTERDKFLVPRSDGEFDMPLQAPNMLNLDERILRQLASSIREQGITRDQLVAISDQRLTDSNPILSHEVGFAFRDIERAGGDGRSFNRGAVLVLLLVDEASADGAPMMGLSSGKLASTYRNQPPTLEDLRLASDRLLASQVALSDAFDEALMGMPEGTDPGMARFGAGIVTLGLMAAAQFGGTGIEAWFEPF